jgi:hypothetical protein
MYDGEREYGQAPSQKDSLYAHVCTCQKYMPMQIVQAALWNSRRLT